MLFLPTSEILVPSFCFVVDPSVDHVSIRGNFLLIGSRRRCAGVWTSDETVM